MASLEAIVQGKREPLRDYNIERFNKKVVQIRGADETMKWYLISKGLREGTYVKKVVRLDRPRTLHEFLAITKIYIRYEEELYTDNLNKSKKEEPAAESSKKPFHEKKKEGKVAREGKRSNGCFTKYTPLAMSRKKILAEIAVADLTEVGVKPPKAPSQQRKKVDKTKYCRFHKCHGHVTDDCIHLKDATELLIQRGRLKQFVKNPESERKTIELIADGNEVDKIVAMSVKHLGDFLDNVEIIPYSCTWEQFPFANVITGGTLNISMRSMKRKFEELMSVNLLVPSSSNIGGRPPLAFYNSELPGGASNSAVLLLVRASMANTDVRRVLIDTRASCDMMYTSLFKTLELTKKNFSPYIGNELYGFNGSSTQPWGYVELLAARRKGGQENNKDPIPGDRLSFSL